MKRKMLLTASLAVALVLGASIVPAGAYFTDTSEANGGVTVTMTPSTDIHEWVEQGVKHVVISNDKEATSAVYVRAGVFASVDVNISGNGWTGPSNDADWVGPKDYGWFYYDQILQPGDSTDNELTVDTELRKKAEQKPEKDENFNVIVMYEATPVLYDENGNPYADWSLTQNIIKPAEGGN